MGLAGMEVELVSDAEGRPACTRATGFPAPSWISQSAMGFMVLPPVLQPGVMWGLISSGLRRSRRTVSTSYSSAAKRGARRLTRKGTRMESYGKMQGEGLGRHANSSTSRWLPKARQSPAVFLISAWGKMCQQRFAERGAHRAMVTAYGRQAPGQKVCGCPEAAKRMGRDRRVKACQINPSSLPVTFDHITLSSLMPFSTGRTICSDKDRITAISE